MEQLLPLSDDGTMQKSIASLGDLLGTMAADPDEWETEIGWPIFRSAS